MASQVVEIIEGQVSDPSEKVFLTMLKTWVFPKAKETY